MTYTSISPLRRTSSSTIEPNAIPSSAAAPACRPRSCVTLRVRAIAEDRRRWRAAPLSVTVSAPSCSASRSVCTTRSRAAPGQAHVWGVSTSRHDPLRAQAPRPCARPRAPAARSAGRLARPPPAAAPASARSARSRGRAVVLHLRVDALGGAPQRQLAQGDQVALAEEVLDRARGLLRACRPCLRCRRWSRSSGVRSISSTSSACSKMRVRHGLAHDHAGDLGHHVVQALDVLDVDGRIDVDAGVEQLLDVLPALGVARAGRVRCAPARRPGSARDGARAPRRDRTPAACVPR